MGTGPDLYSPAGIGLAPNGNIIVGDFQAPSVGAILEVDRTTGDRTLLGSIGSGNLHTLDVDVDGNISTSTTAPTCTNWSAVRPCC